MFSPRRSKQTPEKGRAERGGAVQWLHTARRRSRARSYGKHRLTDFAARWLRRGCMPDGASSSVSVYRFSRGSVCIFPRKLAVSASDPSFTSTGLWSRTQENQGKRALKTVNRYLLRRAPCRPYEANASPSFPFPGPLECNAGLQKGCGHATRTVVDVQGVSP